MSDAAGAGGEAVRRIFAALELGAAARAAAAAAARTLRARPGGSDVRWVREEALHVTLRFLGETPSERIPQLARHLAAAAAGQAPFELALAGLQLFPSPRRPRVVAVGLEPEEPVAALAQTLSAAAVACGFAPEERHFRAHLTLGRLRPGLRTPLDVSGVELPPARFGVRCVVLFQSELHPEGSRYTPLQQFPLGAVPGDADHP